MFITNNDAFLHLWWKKKLVKYQKVSNYYVHIWERWPLNARLWTLGSGLWNLNSGFWILDHRLWTLVAERETVEVKTLRFKTVQSFEKIGAISITSFLNSTLIKICDHFKSKNLSMVYSFQAPLSNHLKILKTRGF